jgi:hypothetical protein
METRDLDLIERYIATDVHLKKLYEQHLDYERRLDEFNHKTALTSAEEFEKKNLKKIKLMGRDQMEFILRKYRESTGA